MIIHRHHGVAMLLNPYTNRNLEKNE